VSYKRAETLLIDATVVVDGLQGDDWFKLRLLYNTGMTHWDLLLPAEVKEG
jgi:hypothetical protein